MEVSINLPTTVGKYYAYQQANLGQKVSFKYLLLRKVVGSDQKLSDTIAAITYVEETKGKKKDMQWFLGYLDALRLSRFATSEKTDILTKLGFMFPKEDEDEEWAEDEG